MNRPGESLKSSDVRDHNLGLVLASLERAGAASRTQLAETTGLVRGALTALITELIEVGLVRTSPVASRSVEASPAPRARAGRPQEKLELDGSRLAVLGLQFTSDRIHLCVVDLAGRSLLRRELAFRAPYGDPEALAAILVEQIEEVFASEIVGSPSIVQWVFAVPAPVLKSTGVIPIAIDLGWHDVDLAGLVSDRIGVPRLGILVVNDANAATYAEFNSLWRNPETAGVTDLIYLKSDTGIGGGAIVAGSVLLGANGFAFEPGHVSAVISHSGAVGSLTVPEAEAIGRRFAEELGIEPTLAGWRSVDETRILDSQDEFNQVPDAAGGTSTPAELVAAIRARPIESMGLAFAPVIDDETVKAPSKTMTSGHSARIPLLLGTTRDEFSFETAGTEETDGSAAFESTIADLARAGIGEREIAQYRREVERIGLQFATSQLVTAQLFRAPAAGIAALRAAHGAGERTWLYDFAHPSAVTGLASHCHELPFAWDVLDAEGVSAVLGAAPQALADEVHDVWVGFITDGTTGWASVIDNVAGARVFGAGGGYDREGYAFEHALLGDAR